MTDDLLDEAEKFAAYLESHADDEPAHVANTDGETVRALVERVQQAEALKNDYAQQYEDAVDARVAAMNERDDKARDGRLRLAAAERERDAARGKLDKVCSLAGWLVSLDDDDPDSPGRVERRTVTLNQIIGKARDVLAILDGKTGD
jgi:hypothetical protein